MVYYYYEKYFFLNMLIFICIEVDFVYCIHPVRTKKSSLLTYLVDDLNCFSLVR